MATPLLEIEDLAVEFATERGRIVGVEAASLTVGERETVVLVGESGSGKSVTALAVMRLLRGRATMRARTLGFRRKDGSTVDLARVSEAAMREIRGNEIAMIFQEPMTSLNPVFTVGRQIAETLMTHAGTSARAARAQAVELLDSLGIAAPERRLASYPHELSGGMRQRVMIAIALACRPKLLIADEPTTALDVTIQAQILSLIAKMQRELGTAILFITHNLGVAAEIADRVVVMYAGRTVEAGPVREIFAAPLMPYTSALIRSVPRLGAGLAKDQSLPTIAGIVPGPTTRPAGCAFHPRCAEHRPGLCDVGVPPYERADDGRFVRCLRWRELAGASA